MGEIRLVPAALVVWAVAAVAITLGVGIAVVVVLVAVIGAVVLRAYGQAVFIAGMGAAAVVTTGVRLRIARAWEPAGQFVGRVSGAPKQTSTGGFIVRVQVDGNPTLTPVFVDEVPDTAVSGAQVVVRGVVKESEMAGINPIAVNGSVEVVAPPQGLAAFAQHTRETFAGVVQATVGESAQGLISGMVLGDVSLQTSQEQQDYIDTGLSHLSAVSGANVAIVTTFAAIAAAAVGLGLRGRIVASAAALLLYASLVGPEPSVLRASVSGLVGLTAVLASRQSEPIHALCLSVIGLVLVDSDLAVHYGFALSVAATAGIVALFPLLYRVLAATGWPDILVRALGVAVAADVATMPIVAMMAGRASLVSVVANVIVAPVTGPVTVLGLAAVLLSLIHGGLAAPVLWVVEPMAYWVRVVAENGARFPGATVETEPIVVVVVYGWFLAGLFAGYPKTTLAAALVCGFGVVLSQAPAGTPVDVGRLRAHVVEKQEDALPIPPGTQLVVVLEKGRPHRRPVVTDQGIPVIFPNRDGNVAIYPDGTQVLPRREF